MKWRSPVWIFAFPSKLTNQTKKEKKKVVLRWFGSFSVQIFKLLFSMVCSIGSGRMAVMARLLAAGSCSQTMAGTTTVRFHSYSVFLLSHCLGPCARWYFEAIIVNMWISVYINFDTTLPFLSSLLLSPHLWTDAYIPSCWEIRNENTCY